MDAPPTNPAVSDYGADSAGLICGYLISASAGTQAVDSRQAAHWLAERSSRSDLAGADAAFAWLHFNLAHTGALPWITDHVAPASEFYEMLSEGGPSTRVERTDESLIAVINDVHFDFAFEPSNISTLWISVEQDLVVTARRRPLRSVDKLRQEVRRGKALRSAADLLKQLLRAQADALVKIVGVVNERVDDVEDQLLSKQLEHRRARLGAQRRLLVRLQRLLAPEPAAFFRLLQQPPRWMSELDVQELNGSVEEFSVVLRDMGTLQERIKLLQEEIAAEVNEGNNRSLFILTVVTVAALPINITAGLFGMNVGGVPLAGHVHGFWIVLGIVLLFTAVAAAIARRRRSEH